MTCPSARCVRRAREEMTAVTNLALEGVCAAMSIDGLNVRICDGRLVVHGDVLAGVPAALPRPTLPGSQASGGVGVKPDRRHISVDIDRRDRDPTTADSHLSR